MAAGLWPALIKRIAHVRGPVPGFSIRGAWLHGTNRAHSGGLWPALIERVVYVRGVWLVGDWKGLAYFAVRGRTGQVASMATGYGSCLSRGLRTSAAPCLGSQFAVRGRTGQVAPGAAGIWLVLIERVAHVRGPVPGFSIRGAWPRGTSRVHGGGLWPALIKRVAHVRGVWLVGDWKGLAMGGVWPGAVHLGWSKSPRWMGARRCAGVPCRKQVWAELFPR